MRSETRCARRNFWERLPLQSGSATPGTETSAGRIKFEAVSYSSDPISLSADTCSANTDTKEALYDNASGGVIPAGSCLSTVCEIAVTCTCAAASHAKKRS
jgi:hypothetical protein